MRLALEEDTAANNSSFSILLKLSFNRLGSIGRHEGGLIYIAQCAVGFNNLNKKVQEVSHFSNVKCS